MSEHVPRVVHDEDAGVLYTHVCGGTVDHTLEAHEGRVLIDVDLDGRVLGVEVLDAPRRVLDATRTGNLVSLQSRAA